ncbi:hypothetical protein EHQ05_16435 [Leptospira yasudae]|uniref:phytanoyl-CoA dioxygenase family protein n=1 Tax=Leptospira yasudae TaxID=2202201 RepID=UPI001082DEAB|nr:phytanoyl-CoA dioxygenase family protein [Leptospira yasudae]TGK24501.1 hypothetical protein EHQ05_16435 [Leptospira yasudae]TGM05713.1 hypothetical protein EHQ86_09790 [Leptospira yasudae]
MKDALLTKDEIAFFETNGYLVLPPGRVFSSDEIRKLKEECDTYFPSFDLKYDVNNSPKVKTGLSGSPRNYVFGTTDISSYKKNFLFAKRSTVIAPKYSQNFVDALENENLLSVNRQLLNSEKLSLHNSAIACVYPGTVAEPGNFHADTSGFSDYPLKAIKAGEFMINSFVYLVDVDEENAPIRLLPKSHKKYLELNERVAPYFRSTGDRNNIGQFNFYDEFIPENYEKPVRITGKSGTVVLIAGDLLHSATSNLSSERIRYTLAVWYSARNNPNFYKDYSVYAPYCKDFISKFKDKGIPYHTYYAHSIGFFFKFKKFLKKYVQGIFGKLFRRIRSSLSKKKIGFLIDLGPWRLNQPSIPDSNQALILSHLSEANGAAQGKLKAFIQKNPKVKNYFLVAPNPEPYLKKYFQKDYPFFAKLPFKQYFFDETWPRYIVRYFSAIASSYAAESECKEALNESVEIFYRNLENIEKKLLDKKVNLSEVESDLPRSRWDERGLKSIAENAGLKSVDIDKNEVETITRILGGEVGAWFVLKFEI